MTIEKMGQAKRRRNPYFKFRAFLDEQGIKQVEVAEMLEINRATLNQKINGTGGDFSIVEVRKICEHYNISSDEFFINNMVSK